MGKKYKRKTEETAGKWILTTNSTNNFIVSELVCGCVGESKKTDQQTN